MTHRSRPFTLAALTFLLLAMPELARAAMFTVNTLADPGSPTSGCSLRQALINASGKSQSGSANCPAGTGTDTIMFSVTGTITLGSTLPGGLNGETLTIVGPSPTTSSRMSPTTSSGITISGGGAVQLMQVNSGATLNLQWLTLADGSTTGAGASHGFDGAGGAILNNGMLTLTNCTLSANQATGGAGGTIGGNGFGGAIFNSNLGTLIVADSTFSANQATGGSGGAEGGNGEGGAIANFHTASVINSTFAANQATGGSGASGEGAGGAIFSSSAGPSSPAVLTVTNSTFSGNQETGGAAGGIFNGGGNSTFTLKGTILAASTGGNCGGSAGTDVSFNIADDATCFTNGTNGNVVESSTSAIGLAAGLAMNGGPTETIALLAGSPAIDQIPFASCTYPAAAWNPCTTPSSDRDETDGAPPAQLVCDQRGEPRPDPEDGADAPCDIGAYEFQGPAATATATASASTTPTATTTATATATATATPTATATATATPTATATAVPVTLKITPKAVKFPKTKVGTPSNSKPVKVSNPKGKKGHPGLPVLIEMISDPPVFTETNNCGASLAAGSSCTISVTFRPSMAVAQFGTLTITDNANGGKQTVSLSGTGK